MFPAHNHSCSKEMLRENKNMEDRNATFTVTPHNALKLTRRF